MSTRSRQMIAAVLALTAAYTGSWAQFAPASFYVSFPGAGHHWVAALGPYNEHLTRDVGSLYLALLAISAWAAARPRGETLALAGAGWLAFSIPHFAYHMFHLGTYDLTGKLGNIIALGGTIVLAALLLIPARGPRRPGTASHPDRPRTPAARE